MRGLMGCLVKTEFDPEFEVELEGNKLIVQFRRLQQHWKRYMAVHHSTASQNAVRSK